MANTKELFHELVGKIEDYGRTSVELSKLKAVQTTARIAGRLASNSIFILILSMFILVLSIGISFWVGDALGETYYGFFIVSGAYLLLFLILKAFATQLVHRPVKRMIIKELLK